MIIFDVETTGLSVPDIPEALDRQPKIIEFAAIKIDASTETEIDRMEFLCSPMESLSKEVVRITKITDTMLQGQREFPYFLNDLKQFFLGEDTLVAHNVMFDVSALKAELDRLEETQRFPWPCNHICTVEKTFHFKNKRLSLSKLYLELFDEKLREAHRAMVDVEALTKCVIELRRKGVL